MSLSITPICSAFLYMLRQPLGRWPGPVCLNPCHSAIIQVPQSYHIGLSLSPSSEFIDIRWLRPLFSVAIQPIYTRAQKHSLQKAHLASDSHIPSDSSHVRVYTKQIESSIPWQLLPYYTYPGWQAFLLHTLVYSYVFLISFFPL